MVSVKYLLLVLAFISLGLATFDIKGMRINLGWLGLALWVLSELVK